MKLLRIKKDKAREKGMKALNELRRQAQENGTADMTMEEIIKEIEKYRNEE